MEFTCYSMLIDFTIAAIFLFLAKLLREKIKILQSDKLKLEKLENNVQKEPTIMIGINVVKPFLIALTCLCD